MGDSSGHPLDECDPGDCYQIMMAERTTLITGRREAEDNLVKNVIQLSSALIAIMTGFITQANIVIAHYVFWIFSIIIVFLSLSIAAGLTEQFLSSKAYQAQQVLLEDYYGKKISEFSEPRINRWVRVSQGIAYILFVLALAMLGIFAAIQAGDKTDVEQRKPTTASTTATAAATSSASTTPAASTTTPAASTGAAHSFGRRQSTGVGN